MNGLHYPMPTTRKLPPLTTAEAMERAEKLMRYDYQNFTTFLGCVFSQFR